MDISKAIAEFMGWEIEKGMENEIDPYYNEPNKQGYIPRMILLSCLQYNKSWDWQAPVWGKLYSGYIDLLNNEFPENDDWAENEIRWLMRKEEVYSIAFRKDNKQVGFEIIGELLEKYNQLKNEQDKRRIDSEVPE